MSNLYVIRHSSTYYHEVNKIAGDLDIPLSDKGIRDSIELGKNFKYENFDVVFTSALSRSFDTAILFLSQLELKKVPIRISRDEYENFAREDLLPIVQFPELNERNYGILQDTDKERIKRTITPETFRKWRRGFDGGPEGGEPFMHVLSRVSEFYREILIPALENKDVLIVAHQNTIRALYYLIYDLDKEDIDDIEFDNGEIWHVSFRVEELGKKRGGRRQ